MERRGAGSGLFSTCLSAGAFGETLSCIAEPLYPKAWRPAAKPAATARRQSDSESTIFPAARDHFAVAGERQSLKAEGRHRRVGSKDANRRELPRSHGRENPMAGGRCREHAEQKGAADIDDHRSPGKCLADTPRNKSGQPESRCPAENAAQGNPDHTVDRIHRMPRLVFTHFSRARPKKTLPVRPPSPVCARRNNLTSR